MFAGVRVDPIGGGRSGQILRAELEDRLNPEGAIPANAAYRLSVQFNTQTVPIGVARDSSVSRYNIYITSHYVLYRNADGKAIASGDLGYVNSYNNLRNQYFSTYVSEQDATRRNIIELSELYRQRLAAYLDEGAPEQPEQHAERPPAGSAYTPVLFNEMHGAPPVSRPTP